MLNFMSQAIYHEQARRERASAKDIARHARLMPSEIDAFSSLLHGEDKL
jgi:hypothetical protein